MTKNKAAFYHKKSFFQNKLITILGYVKIFLIIKQLSKKYEHHSSNQPDKRV